jgi:hypothetical protein
MVAGNTHPVFVTGLSGADIVDIPVYIGGNPVRFNH